MEENLAAWYLRELSAFVEAVEAAELCGLSHVKVCQEYLNPRVGSHACSILVVGRDCTPRLSTLLCSEVVMLFQSVDLLAVGHCDRVLELGVMSSHLRGFEE